MIKHRLAKLGAVDMARKIHAKEPCIVGSWAHAGASPGQCARQLPAPRPLRGSLCDHSAESYMRICVSGGYVRPLNPAAASVRLAYPTSDNTF